MAYIEFNALSTVLCGSFTARIFLPEMDKLQLDDAKHMKKYPVLYLLHNEGNSSREFFSTSAERCAAEYGIFIIAPDAHHSMGSKMQYGPDYERFLFSELPGICRNTFPVIDSVSGNWIGGIGTGAYGAIKTYVRHQDIFSACVSIDGVLDIGRICRQALENQLTNIHHNKASLEAVFGDITCFEGGRDDLFALSSDELKTGRVFLSASTTSKYVEESRKLADKLGTSVVYREYSESDTNGICFTNAINWLVKEVE